MNSAKYEYLVGVYNADGDILGELAYVFKKAIGKTKCGLCDLTHGGVTMKDAWKKAEK